MPCKICKSQSIDKITLKNQKIYSHCIDCNFLSLDDQFFLSLEDEKQRYLLHENQADNQGYYQWLGKFVNDTKITEIKDLKKVLDYGCGPERVLAEILKKHNFEVESYDPIFNPIELKPYYDLVCSTEVFEHFYNPLESIERICKLIKPGGYLAVMTSFLCPIEEFKAWRYKDDATHVSFYSIKTFEKIAEIFKMKILWHDGVNKILIQNSKQ